MKGGSESKRRDRPSSGKSSCLTNRAFFGLPQARFLNPEG